MYTVIFYFKGGTRLGVDFADGTGETFFPRLVSGCNGETSHKA
jgi:hypothetical protein